VLARNFPGTSVDSIGRHKKNHMPPQLQAALLAAGRPTNIDLEELRKSESEGLLQHLVAQRGRLYALLDTCEDFGDVRAAATVHDKIISNLSLTARLLGEIATASVSVQTNLIVTPEYLHLRQALLQALQPFKGARQAVVNCLKTIETQEPILLEQTDARE
jgi:hypothetical protein